MVRIVTGNDNSPNIACPHSQGREIYELPVNDKKENKQWLYIEIHNYLINIVHTNNTIYDDDHDHDHDVYNDIGAGDDDGENVVIRKGRMTNKIYSSIHES